MEDVLYNLCGGDVLKFSPAKKIKVSDAGIFLMLKEKENFMQWYINHNE